MEKPATLNSYVLPICLPDQAAFTTKSAIATGYGKTGNFEGPSNELMKVIIEYMKPETCNNAFEYSSMLANNRFDDDAMICSGSTNKTGDSCNVS